EAAEAVKLVNNCHTDLIYSFGNEVALFAERLALDPLELIRAANVDYPRPDLARPGFVGGGCLSKDPYILMASSIAAGYEPWLVAPETIARLGVTPVMLDEGFAGADAVLVITDHPEYGKQDLPKLLGSLRRPAVLYDCWRVLDEETVRAGGIRYASIGYG